jgi:uncharacterized protein with GYD domain
MPKFIAFFKMTSGTITAAMENPTDRAQVVERTAQAAGGRLECYYWMFGEHDGFAIAELPDSRAMAAVALAASSTGAFSSFETHELISAADVNDRLAEAKRITAVYTPPGAQPR